MKRSLAFVMCLAAPLACSCGPEPSREHVVAPPRATAAVADAGAPLAKRFDYPATPQVDVVDTLHGRAIRDRFRWLENGSSAQVKAWVHAEDAFARARLEKLADRDAIASRLAKLFYVESESAPSKEKNRWFWSHRAAKQEKAVVYWKQGKTGAPKVLLDPNAWSTDGSVSLGEWAPSHDGVHVAYLQKEHNSDEATLHVIEVATGKVSTVDVIDGAKYAGVSWTPRGDGFYYTHLPPVGPTVSVAERPGFADVRFHRLGADPAKDRIVRSPTHDPKTFVGAEISRDGHFLFLYVMHGWSSTDVFYKDLRAGSAVQKPWTTLVSGQPHKYNVWAYKDRFYVETDDGAPNHRVMRVDPKKPERSAWVEIVPERRDAALDEANLVGGKLALEYLKDVVSHVEVHDLDGKLVREIALPAKGAASTLSGNPDDDEAYFTFTSFTFPTEIFETSVKTGATKLHFKLDVPVDPSKYDVDQAFARSKDGTKIPYFVVSPKGVDLSKAPALVYGYGGFLVTMKPHFTSSAYPWLERGGIYVVANLRGGGEYGEPWHRAGMRHNKQNVFDDFRAVVEAVIKSGVSPDRIAVRGASNGGLLVAAAITQFPQLFRVGLCGVPLVDMLRYQKFGSGKTWIEEYGTADDPADFESLYAYSPYQHVTAGTRYPSVLILSADSDDRVDPMHARKFAAELQTDSAGGPVLLRVEKNAGHGGADTIKSLVAEIADELAFALDEMKKPR
jgi:prolyl oligopeptidase